MDAAERIETERRRFICREIDDGDGLYKKIQSLSPPNAQTKPTPCNMGQI